MIDTPGPRQRLPEGAVLAAGLEVSFELAERHLAPAPADLLARGLDDAVQDVHAAASSPLRAA